MSSSTLSVVLLVLAAASPAVAQEKINIPIVIPSTADPDPTPMPTPVTAEQAMETANKAYGPPVQAPKKSCPPAKAGGEIVVCGRPMENQAKYRVKSSADLDPTGVGAKGDVPRAPDLEPHYPGPVVARGCFVPPCPPPMPKLIDLKAIPEAPPGSDADRVGHGLATTGYQGPKKPKTKETAATKDNAPPEGAPRSATETDSDQKAATPPG